MSDFDPVSIFVSDSRGWGFDKYKQPGDLKFEYVLRRGALVNDLVDETLKLLRRYGDRVLVVKIALGINEFTCFVSHRNGTELRFSSINEKTVFDKLIEFKHKIKSVNKSCLVGFITIPPISFEKNRQYRLDIGKLKESTFSDLQIVEFQDKLNEQVSLLNTRIRLENSTQQSGHRKGCRTISWHNDIVRLSKVRNRRGVLRNRIRNDFSKLYDGIHATSYLKQKWFKELCKCVEAELKYTISETAASVHVEFSPEQSGTESSESESEKAPTSQSRTGTVAESDSSIAGNFGDLNELVSDEESWDFKRAKKY